MRYFLHLAYNGAPFFGWQVQPDHPSVQEVLERSLSLLLHQEHIAVTGCGRTDTGVHAADYYAHFELEETLDAEGLKRLRDQLNSFLPKEIAIFDIFPVKPRAHARFDAVERTYQYFVSIRKNPFTFQQRYFSFRTPDIERMNEAAALLLENEDFTSFSKVHTQVNNFICHVTHAQWVLEGDDLVFTITANRFLRNMVRAVVGTLLDVGFGKLSVSDFQNIINQKDRCKAGISVPADALFLTNVRYNWPEIIEDNDE
ncbi:MAG: tRNA pseudouridine(38-40) synthase TruA [Bacteroidales bacterium]|nr:tRNA pseudouridine(38-40) synthase TruA [Bacteroidales bacterium]